MNFEIYCGPQSLMTFSGNPWCLKTSSWNIVTCPSDDNSIFVLMKWACFNFLSTIMLIALYPLNSGSGPIRSMDICCQLMSGIS
jgi:hypothetical protein